LLLLNDRRSLYKMYAICSPRGALRSQLSREKLDMLEEPVVMSVYCGACHRFTHSLPFLHDTFPLNGSHSEWC
jgi:hypothetical protein